MPLSRMSAKVLRLKMRLLNTALKANRPVVRRIPERGVGMVKKTGDPLGTTL